MAKKKIKIPVLEVERQIAEDGVIKNDIISAKTQLAILRQVESEFDLAWGFNQSKRRTMLSRLKLYNNQKRDPEAVGDPLLFSVFNTIHASLYDDRLIVKWEGRGGEGDEDVEENLNAMSEYDYDQMQKNELDYMWNWDAEFFGRGLVLLNEFDRKKMCPVPENLDPTTFIRDPRANSVNGDMSGKGAMRFGYWEVGMSYWEMKNNPAFFNLELLKKSKEIKSMIDDARDLRRQAQGLEHFTTKEEALGKMDNYEFQLLNGFTHIRGVKYLVTLANGRNTIVRLQKLKYQDRWPILDRPLYPIPGDWDGVSIPDLVEDKQRARAVLLNLGLKSAKADVMPMYAFDQTRIKNKNDLNFRTNKFIGVDGRVDNSIMAIQKSTVHQYVDGIMNILDLAAQKATATPDAKQAIASKGQRTLGELEMLSTASDTRYSMSAKIYGWSEARFWQQYYRLYKKHFLNGIDEKIVRIQGAFAPIWRPLMRDNIISEIDPDVKIESRVISEARRMRENQEFQGFAVLAIQEPGANRRKILKHAAKLQGIPREVVDGMFPKSPDEYQAEDENALLNKEKMPQISIQDEHAVHLEIHAKANPNPQTLAHIRQHKKMMIEKRNRIDLFPPEMMGEITPPGMNKMSAPPAGSMTRV